MGALNRAQGKVLIVGTVKVTTIGEKTQRVLIRVGKYHSRTKTIRMGKVIHIRTSSHRT